MINCKDTVAKVYEDNLWLSNDDKIILHPGYTDDKLRGYELKDGLLITGASGSGKSNLVRAILLGLMYQKSPDNLHIVYIGRQYDALIENSEYALDVDISDYGSLIDNNALVIIDDVPMSNIGDLLSGYSDLGIRFIVTSQMPLICKHSLSIALHNTKAIINDTLGVVINTPIEESFGVAYIRDADNGLIGRLDIPFVDTLKEVIPHEESDGD